MQSLLITVDALRADHLGQYGYQRETMPVLDRMFDDGVRFDNAFANGPYTRISVPSLHSSRYLAYDRLDELPTIASVLGKNDIRTACIGTRTGFASKAGELVFDDYVDFGRDDHNEDTDDGVGGQIRDRIDSAARSYVGPALLKISGPLYDSAQKAYDSARSQLLGDSFDFKGYTSADQVTDAAVDWISDHTGEDFFLWLHYMEGHRPYGVHDTDPAYLDAPLEESEIKRLMKKAGTNPDAITEPEHELLLDLYDSDLRYCSAEIDRLVDNLQSLGVWDDATVLFSSDHGEEFREHDYYFHRNLPYDELLHVPLFLRGPTAEPAVISEQRQLLDVAPTVCDAHSIDFSQAGFLGTPLLDGDERKIIAVGAQNLPTQVVAGRWDGWKYIHTDRGDELYDLEADPEEQASVTTDHPDRIESFEDEIPTAIYENDPEELRDPDGDVDREQLEALGYLEV